MQQGNTQGLKAMVRQSFRSNLGETDPQKILAHKEAAIRGLSNFMFHEAQVLTKDHKPPPDTGLNG